MPSPKQGRIQRQPRPKKEKHPRDPPIEAEDSRKDEEGHGDRRTFQRDE